jgi:fatty-acyl-CoA synthase
MDEEGYCNIVGRIKDMVIRGGENVYPREIEEFLYSHEAVSDVSVVGVPDERFGEAVAAVVALAPGRSADEDEISEAVERSGLARFKRPRHVVVVDTVPRGPNGKADYAWARETARARVGS